MIPHSVGQALPENAVLWRYLDFHKLLSFIREKGLHFSRMDKMEDKLEGISHDHLLKVFGSGIPAFPADRSNPDNRELNERQKRYFLNCWLIHHRESVAMWNSYSNDSGIAIKVPAARLIQAITEECRVEQKHHGAMKDLYHGPIVYKDFFDADQRRLFKEEIKVIGFQKDTSFEHEKEYRFLIKQDRYWNENHEAQSVKLELLYFEDMEFDLVFHPKMEGWKKDNINAVIESLGAKNIRTHDSELQLKRW